MIDDDSYAVLTRGQYDYHWCSRDVFAEEITGEPINDAVINRNQAVESRFNFTIREEIGSVLDPTDPS